MSEPGVGVAYEFGPFRLDARQRLLLSLEGNRPITLPPKALEMLLYLVERRGELVEKADLMQAIWPRTVVEENSLNRSISTLRRVLGEDPGEHRFIATLPGRGYRFVAEVKVLDGSRKSIAPERAVASSAPSSATNSESRPSIAVLPFANLTGEPEKEYFSDGMAEELIHRLTRVPALRVAARTSSFAYKGRNTDIRQIARDLDVATVLEGSVRGAGEQVRVTAQLVDGHTGYHVWSQSYDREFADLFKLQDELAGAIVQTLGNRMHLTLRVGEAQVRPTDSLEAYHLYLQGNALRDRADSKSLQLAAELCRRAITLDPKFARAHCALAEAYVFSVVLDYQWPTALDMAEREASLALLLDPNLAEAAVVLGQASAFRGNWLAAEIHFSSALTRDASFVPRNVIHANFLATVGHFDASGQEARAIFKSAPAAPGLAMGISIMSSMTGDDAEALKHADLAISLGAPENAGVLPLVYSHAARRAGRYGEAADRAVLMLPTGVRDAGGAEVVRLIYAAMGDDTMKATAVAALQSLQEKAGSAGMDSSLMVLLVMDWYTTLGDLDRAYDTGIRGLERFKRSGTVGGTWGGLWLPEMRPFRRDPRFQAFAERLGLMDYWKQFGAPDSCELRDGKLICH